MSLSFFGFLEQLRASPALLVTVLLTLAVMLVNGWTDAPNAIAGAVVTGALSFGRAAALAAVCNLLGVLCVTSVTASVARTVYSIAAFSGGTRETLCALCAAMTAIVLWAVAAWLFGIPTSESHALVAGVSGAAAALEGSLSCIRWGSWGKVLLGLALSTAAGCLGGHFFARKALRLKWPPRTLRRAQTAGRRRLPFCTGRRTARSSSAFSCWARRCRVGGRRGGRSASRCGSLFCAP